LDFPITEQTGLAGLFVASFVAATVLPLSSEVVLFGFLRLHPDALVTALVLATLGNTAGGMTTYWLGRIAPAPRDSAGVARVRRFGAIATAFAWLPVIGDGLCLAAGWLRLDWVAVAAAQGVGRGLRYILVAWFAGGT